MCRPWWWINLRYHINFDSTILKQSCKFMFIFSMSGYVKNWLFAYVQNIFLVSLAFSFPTNWYCAMIMVWLRTFMWLGHIDGMLRIYTRERLLVAPIFFDKNASVSIMALYLSPQRGKGGNLEPGLWNEYTFCHFLCAVG